MGVFQSLIGTGKVPIFFGFWPLHVIFIIFAFWLIRKRTNNKPLLPSFQKK
jgi:lipopolysaccharide export LptBFGC system permease protein LptF